MIVFCLHPTKNYIKNLIIIHAGMSNIWRSKWKTVCKKLSPHIFKTLAICIYYVLNIAITEAVVTQDSMQAFHLTATEMFQLVSCKSSKQNSWEDHRLLLKHTFCMCSILKLLFSLSVPHSSHLQIWHGVILSFSFLVSISPLSCNYYCKQCLHVSFTAAWLVIMFQLSSADNWYMVVPVRSQNGAL